MTGHGGSHDAGVPVSGVRAAASLLVVFGHRSPRVLMGRRPATARFMPGVYVFPGGAVERRDRSVATCGSLAPADVRLMRAADEAEARTLAVAAVRETFEETSVLCGCEGGGERRSWGDVLEGRSRVDLSAMSYLGRALTPSVSRIRFHARFFFTHRGSDALPVGQTQELEDLCWVDPGDPGPMPLAGVTRFLLGELGRRLAGIDDGMRPFWHRESGDFHVEYDTDPGE